MKELNQNIEVIAVEAIAQSRVLLALKGTEIQDPEATCLSVVLGEGTAYPTNKIDLIARATTFNAYNFIPQVERENYMLLFKRYLNNDSTEEINDLLIPKSK